MGTGEMGSTVKCTKPLIGGTQLCYLAHMVNDEFYISEILREYI